jgi:hypothetical protein
MNKRSLSLGALALALCGAGLFVWRLSLDAAGSVAPIVARAEALVSPIDREGASVTFSPDPSSFATRPEPGAADSLERIPGVARSLDAHLKRHPDDARGWVTLARLVEELRMFSKMAPPYANPALDAVGRDTVDALMARALAADSTRAETWFWRGVFEREAFNDPYAQRSGVEQDFREFNARALPAFERAYALRPDGKHHRAAYVEALVGAGRFVDAERVEQEGIADPSRRRHRVVKIMDDWTQVPIPPAAGEVPAASLMMRGLATQFPGDSSRVLTASRFRSISCPMSADSVLAFYRRAWPTAVVHRDSADSSPNPFFPFASRGSIFLRWTPEGLVPSKTSKIDFGHLDDIVTVLVMQFEMPEGLEAQPSDEPAPASLIWMIDGRRLDP